MPETIREVKLPTDLCQAAEQRYGARFGTLEKFLTHVLQELTSDDAAKMDQAEQKVIEERLRDLGYL